MTTYQFVVSYTLVCGLCEEREGQIQRNLRHLPFTQNRKQALKGSGESLARAQIVKIPHSSGESIPAIVRPARGSLAFDDN